MEDRFKVTKVGNNIYVYKGGLIASYSKETGSLYTYNLSKKEKRKVVKIIKAALRVSKVEKRKEMVVV